MCIPRHIYCIARVRVSDRSGVAASSSARRAVACFWLGFGIFFFPRSVSTSTRPPPRSEWSLSAFVFAVGSAALQRRLVGGRVFVASAGDRSRKRTRRDIVWCWGVGGVRGRRRKKNTRRSSARAICREQICVPRKSENVQYSRSYLPPRRQAIWSRTEMIYGLFTIVIYGRIFTYILYSYVPAYVF